MVITTSQGTRARKNIVLWSVVCVLCFCRGLSASSFLGQLSVDSFPRRALGANSNFFVAWREPLKVVYKLSGSACGDAKTPSFKLVFNNTHSAISARLWHKLLTHLGKPVSSVVPAAWQKMGQNKLSFFSTLRPESDCHLRIILDYPVTDFDKVDAPVMHGFKNNLKPLDDKIRQDIDKGFPSVVLMIIKDGHIVFNRAYGCRSRLNQRGKPIERHHCVAVNKDTIYDLASLTKIFGVTIPIMHQAFLKKNNKLGIDIHNPLNRYAKKYNPSFVDTSVEQLLRHSAGNPPDIELFDKGYYDPKFAKHWQPACGLGFYSLHPDTSKKIEYTFPVFDSETRGKNIYSDVDFIILGFGLGDYLHRSLSEELNRLYLPLFSGTDRSAFIGYRPLDNPYFHGGKNIASTTYGDTMVCGDATHVPPHFYPNRRTALMTGVVNDPTAYHSLGQVSGHAGLFANIRSLGILSQLVLNGGGYGVVKLFDKAEVDAFIAPSYATGDPSFALGWRSAAAPVGTGDSYLFGAVSSPEVFGHDGWTGTFVVIDRVHNLIILGLTNKRNTLWNKINQYNDRDSKGRFIDTYTVPVYGQVVNLVYQNLKGGFPGHYFPKKFQEYLQLKKSR